MFASGQRSTDSRGARGRATGLLGAARAGDLPRRVGALRTSRPGWMLASGATSSPAPGMEPAGRGWYDPAQGSRLVAGRSLRIDRPVPRSKTLGAVEIYETLIRSVEVRRVQDQDAKTAGGCSSRELCQSPRSPPHDKARNHRRLATPTDHGFIMSTARWRCQQSTRPWPWSRQPPRLGPTGRVAASVLFWSPLMKVPPQNKHPHLRHRHRWPPPGPGSQATGARAAVARTPTRMDQGRGRRQHRQPRAGAADPRTWGASGAGEGWAVGPHRPLYRTPGLFLV